MPRGRRKAELNPSDDERQTLKTGAGRPKSTQQLAQRARIVLTCADGLDNKRGAAKLGVTTQAVGKGRASFLGRRRDGLADRRRPGAPRKVTDEDVQRVVTKARETKPKSATRGSTRGMAEATGLSQSTISRVWRAFGPKPHRTETFKLSNDPYSIDRARDVVGLDMNPPDRAIVLCVDEKSQVQALGRTQPLLPMQPGQAGRRTHDYVRHGTPSLFAALDVATGEVIGSCHRRHRPQEFLKSLNEIDANVPKGPGVAIHRVMDNYGPHEAPPVTRWSLRHPEYHLHSTPTSGSWLDLVERFFAQIAENRIRRGAFRRVAALEQAIKAYLEDHDRDPRPFVWTADADLILGRVKAICERTSDSGH